MAERDDKLLADFEANKLTIEDVEIIIEMLAERGEPKTPTEAAILAKLRWHVVTAYNTGDE